jgi:hypothetical protein
MMKIKRAIQLISGVHKVHHIVYSYGWKIPLLEYGYFKGKGIKKIGTTKAVNGKQIKDYHNCTTTNRY